MTIPVPFPGSNPISAVRATAPITEGEVKSKEIPTIISPEKLREQISALMAGPGSFNTKALKLMSMLEKLAPEEVGRLQKFCEANATKMKFLSEHGGWKEALPHLHGEDEKSVKEMREGMDAFRKEAVGHVIAASLAAMKAMGFDPPGSYSATGTAGWKSDIDTVFFAPKGMPEEFQTVQKLMFDMLFQGVFGASPPLSKGQALPGELLDTSSYLNQAGAALATEKHMRTPAGKAGLARLELNAANLQMLRQCGGPSSPEWEAYKESHIDEAATDALRDTLLESFYDVEHFERDVARAVNKQIAMDAGAYAEGMSEKELDEVVAKAMKENPHARKLAMMSYKSSGLIELSKQMDICKAQIAVLQKKCDSTEVEMCRPQQRVAWQKDYAQLEKLHLKLASLYLARTSFFDEAYNTQGAFTKVCFTFEGQIHQREVEKFQETLQEARIDNKSINALIAQGKGFKLGSGQRERASISQEVASAQENLAMYKGHYSHAIETGSAHQKAVIATSKYSERTLRSNQEILAAAMKTDPKLREDPNFRRVLAENERLLFIASELEKTKRSVALNHATTQELLFDALSPNVPRENWDSLRASIKELADMSEPGGMLGRLKMEESLTWQEKYLALISRLANQGFLVIRDEEDAHGFLVSNNPEVDAILKARVGTPSSLAGPETEKLHSKSEQITLKELQLDKVPKISAFNKALEKITRMVYNIAVLFEVVPMPQAGGAAEMSLRYHWQDATRTGESI